MAATVNISRPLPIIIKVFLDVGACSYKMLNILEYSKRVMRFLLIAIIESNKF